MLLSLESVATNQINRHLLLFNAFVLILYRSSYTSTGHCRITMYCCCALQELCAGFELLEEILVLRLEGGAEHYIPVMGRYASHAFGAPLEQLSARHGSQVCTVVQHSTAQHSSTITNYYSWMRMRVAVLPSAAASYVQYAASSLLMLIAILMFHE